MWGSNQIHTVAVYSGNIGAEVCTDLKLTDALAVDAWLGDADAAGNQILAKLLLAHLHLLAEQGDDRLFYGRVGNNLQDVALVDSGLSVYHLVVLVAVFADNL